MGVGASIHQGLEEPVHYGLMATCCCELDKLATICHPMPVHILNHSKMTTPCGDVDGLLTGTGSRIECNAIFVQILNNVEMATHCSEVYGLPACANFGRSIERYATLMKPLNDGELTAYCSHVNGLPAILVARIERYATLV